MIPSGNLNAKTHFKMPRTCENHFFDKTENKSSDK